MRLPESTTRNARRMRSVRELRRLRVGHLLGELLDLRRGCETHLGRRLHGVNPESIHDCP
jgi:hypothetical protein